MLVSEFSELFLSLMGPNYKASTKRTYADILREYILPAIGTMQVNAVLKMHLTKLNNDLTDKISGSRINMIIAVERLFFQEAIDNGLTELNPALNLKRAKVVTPEIHPLSKEQVMKALQHVDEFYRPFFTFLAMTGARPNEAYALKWNAVDFESNRIAITEGRVCGVEDTPKSRAGKREIFMPPALRNTLLDLQDRIADHHVFLSKKGEPMNGNISRIWQKALSDAGLPAQPAYELRHAFISNALREGVDLTYVSASAGHADVMITAKRYNKVIADGANKEELKLQSMWS